MQKDENYFNGFTYSDRFNLARNNIPSFVNMWNAALRSVIENVEKQGQG
jgi:hypothetical protein